jgi:hypothetical protein
MFETNQRKHVPVLLGDKKQLRAQLLKLEGEEDFGIGNGLNHNAHVRMITRGYYALMLLKHWEEYSLRKITSLAS